MLWRRLTLASAVAPLAVLLLGGCLFSPRDPDGPPQEGGTAWQPPYSTSIVLTNLRAALQGEDPLNYGNCFADTFRFHVDPQDSLDAGQEAYDRYALWRKADEEYAMSGIFSDAASLSLVFTNVEQPDETQDQTYRRDNYRLTIVWEGGAHVNEQITYEGRATLWMRRDDTGRWAIFRWVDRRPDPHIRDTWGVLRGDYRS